MTQILISFGFMLVALISLLIFKYKTGLPSYKCEHKWDEIASQPSCYGNRHLYSCKCGKLKKMRM